MGGGQVPPSSSSSSSSSSFFFFSVDPANKGMFRGGGSAGLGIDGKHVFPRHGALPDTEITGRQYRVVNACPTREGERIRLIQKRETYI